MQRLYGRDANKRTNKNPAVGNGTMPKENQNMDKYQNTYRIDSARLKHYDYANPGLYFVTICTANHEHFFGEIVDGEMQLSPIGVIADVLWHEIKHHTPNIALHEFVVMPNHIHGIIEILEPNIPTNVSRKDVACNVSTCDTTSSMSQISPVSGSLGRIIASYKGSVTKHANRLDLAFSWQPRFYDHIIRDHESLVKIQEYIINNPIKWAEDKLFTPSNRRDVARNVSGFTMVELVVTIVIIGILASMGGMFISRPIEGYVDLKRRAELVDQAEMSLRRMQRDIRAALPNSIRVFDFDSEGKAKSIEMLHVVDGGRYRRLPDDDGNDQILSFTEDDNSFEVLGGLQHFSDVDTENDFVVIYNLTATGSNANAYSGDNIKQLHNTSTESILQFDPAVRFPYSSPYQRFFIVDEAVTYMISDGKLTRHVRSTFDNSQPDPEPEDGDLVAKFIDEANSSFDYSSATSKRSGLVTMRLTLEDKEERISLLHQVHVDNAP
jgi:MSHA biogenesis protein MshO